jgi:hypothetical protein
MLDLHHFGAEARHQLRPERQRLHLLGRQHPHSVERLAVALGVGVANLSELQRRSPSFIGAL